MRPEENPFRPTICGEDYRLVDFPRDASGDALWQGSRGEDFERYIHWLADYLDQHRDVAPAPKQQKLLVRMHLPGNEENCAVGIGWHAAYYELELVDLDYRIAEVLDDGLSFCERDLDRILDQFLEYAPEPGDRTDWSVVRDHYTREDVAERIR